jgi:hypothetical protein
MPKIKNVDIGPCWASFGIAGSEVNLGWTQGGVKVSFATESTETEADQETEPIMTSITKRPISVAVPALEYTLELLAMALPGSIHFYNAATLTTNLAGENNDLKFTAKTGGGNIGPGNDITIEYANPGATQAACAVTVEDRAITVILKHSGTDITATASEVKAAIEADDDAKLLVTVANAGEDTGAGVVTAMAATALTGGKEKLVLMSAANQDLMEFAGSLILHPSKREAGDKSLDMWFPAAIPIGTFDLDYNKTNPKIVNINFKVHPDSSSRTVIFGDPTTTEDD